MLQSKEELRKPKEATKPKEPSGADALASFFNNLNLEESKEEEKVSEKVERPRDLTLNDHQFVSRKVVPPATDLVKNMMG